MTNESVFQTTDLLPAKDYVQTCFPTAQAKDGDGYVCIQAKTSNGTVWLGSAPTESQAWEVMARYLDRNGGYGDYVVPSWSLASQLRQATELQRTIWEAQL